MPTKVESLWDMSFLVPLIDFNLGKHGCKGTTKIECMWAMYFLFSAPYCLQLGKTCKLNV